MKPLVWLALLLLAVVSCRPAPRVPDAPTHRVTDGAGMLQATTVTVLEEQLRAYQAKTGHHVIVWTAKTLPKGMSREAFGLLAINEWGIGRDGHDDGAILFVFPGEAHGQQLRIEVGYGLNAALTDAECARIVLSVIPPLMARGEPDAAVVEGVAAILDAIEAP